MRESEVKKLIGQENWNLFLDWMRGQTIGMYPDGETNYYKCDVAAFLEKLHGRDDRQRNLLRWD